MTTPTLTKYTEIEIRKADLRSSDIICIKYTGGWVTKYIYSGSVHKVLLNFDFFNFVRLYFTPLHRFFHSRHCDLSNAGETNNINWSVGVITGTEPSFVLLVHPVLSLLWQVRRSALKKKSAVRIWSWEQWRQQEWPDAGAAIKTHAMDRVLTGKKRSLSFSRVHCSLLIRVKPPPGSLQVPAPQNCLSVTWLIDVRTCPRAGWRKDVSLLLTHHYYLHVHCRLFEEIFYFYVKPGEYSTQLIQTTVTKPVIFRN